MYERKNTGKRRYTIKHSSFLKKAAILLNYHKKNSIVKKSLFLQIE